MEADTDIKMIRGDTLTFTVALYDDKEFEENERFKKRLLKNDFVAKLSNNLGLREGFVRQALVSTTNSLCSNSYKRDFSEGDKVYFTVKNRSSSKTPVFQKLVTEFDDGRAIIQIEPEDTVGVKAKTYYYDVQIVTANGVVKTVIPPTSRFKIVGDITHEY